MKCLICGSEELEQRETIVSDFIMARVSDSFEAGRGKNYPTKLCFCKRCTFAFYDYRISDEESGRLYDGYRGKKYQKTRERYECWYTAKVNEALNSDTAALESQKTVIERIVSQNVKHELRTALDYGGNESRTFTPMLGTQEKFVYDISHVETIAGVQGISDFDELKKHHFDFVMCNHLFEHLADPVGTMRLIREIGDQDTIFYIETPSENPFTKENKFSIRKNFALLFNPTYSNLKLTKYYFQQRKQPFMPMKEHINFYTPESMRKLAEMNGFRVLDVQENEEQAALGSQTVLSMLFRLEK